MRRCPRAAARQVLLPIVAFGPAAWTPDGSGITVAHNRNGVSNIYLHTLDGKGGATERQLTRFTADTIPQLAWSPDGKRLAIARGSDSSDVVLLTRATGASR